MSLNEIEEIKARLDIVDLISQYVALKKAGVNYKGVCPFHQEKTPSMMVSPQKQIWKCFGCGRGGDHYKFVMEAEHLEFGDALRLLAQKAGVKLQPRTQAEHQSQDRKERLFRINALASKVFQKLLLESAAGKSAREYLKKRGLKDATIKEFGLGLAPRGFDLKKVMAKHDVNPAELSRAGAPERFFDRIMFPIFDVLGNVIAFTGRALGDAEPKYINSPETPVFNKSRVLYGLNFAKGAIKDKDYVVLVEGQMDVIALHQAGAQNTVASSGTAITETQLLILSKYTTNFMLAFDNDTAGKQTTRKTIELLIKNDLNNKIIDFGSHKDAGELFEKSPADWPKAVKTAKEGVDWLLDQETALAGPIYQIENKKQVIKAMLPVLSLIQDETRLDHYVQRVSLATESKPESVYAAIEKVHEKQVGSIPTTPSGRKAAANLTNEEQLLAIVLQQPSLLIANSQIFDEIVWQSVDAERIAKSIGKSYDDKTLVTNQSRFLSQVKTPLDSQLAEKIDSWLFWLTQTWPEFNETIGKELLSEKAGQLTSRKYEQQKETLAHSIRRAQEKGDLAGIKKLMSELNELAKKKN